VRISVDGTLYLCLGQDDKFEFGPLLKSGASDREIDQAILQAVALKPLRHEFREAPKKLVRFMSMTGG
jgi:cyclic pyranopterin phosphate synthase